MINAVRNYKTILNAIPHIIDISGYKNEYLAKKLGMQPANFSIKKQRGNWSVDEVETLLATLRNDDVEDYFLLLEMEALEEEGYETISLADFKKTLEWK